MFQAGQLRSGSRSLGRGSLLDSGNSLSPVGELVFVGQRSLGRGIQHALDILPIMRDGVGDLGEPRLSPVCPNS